MKKSKVLSTPTRLRDLSFDDLYPDDGTQLKAELLNARKWRQFKKEMTT
ncbi:MAG TPA: hypothetical protein VK674_07130 [Candidatus Limnocylindria bacterium]|nr:hypothetical protein [Candidatus Limnocylindria bacterium]